ncbi:MAG: ABC transporter ATP-binding protein [Limnochordaceae bacterium]|nr:ABC transporter ATP-binding protein [Limnochordaceae bacterium]
MAFEPRDDDAVVCTGLTKHFWETPGNDREAPDPDGSGTAPGNGHENEGSPAAAVPRRAAAAAWRRLWPGRRPRRRVSAVDGIDLAVRRGEIFGIIGPNGSGKSTLIRLMATLLIPDGGTIRIFGHDVAREQLAVRRLINRVSVEASFFKKLSALENLSYAARLYDVPPRDARREALRILHRLGLAEAKLTCPLEELSRGMQQKVAIARALLTSPVLLLLDEPTTGLDPRSKREVQEFVQEVRRQHDATVILTTHDMDEAERLCDRVAFIMHGKIVAQGSPEQLKRSAPGRRAATLEELFLMLTGSDWKSVVHTEEEA